MQYGVSSRGMVDSCNNRHFRSSDVTVPLTHLVFAASGDRTGREQVSLYSRMRLQARVYDYTLRP